MLKKRVKNDETEETPISPITETLDFDKPSYVFKPEAGHEWKQRGPYLVCISCELQHAVWIGMEKIMVGQEENGKPILKNRKEIEHRH